MILDLRELKRKGKDSQDFFFEYPLDNEIIDIPSVEFSVPTKINGTVTITGDHSAYVEGEILFTLKGNCTRCLKETERTYSAFFEEQCDTEKDCVYPLVNDKVDLKEIVRDAVLSDMPYSFLCKDDCKGLCQKCGANLNDGDCQCKK